jgi:hypothetical protein
VGGRSSKGTQQGEVQEVIGELPHIDQASSLQLPEGDPPEPAKLQETTPVEIARIGEIVRNLTEAGKPK